MLGGSRSALRRRVIFRERGNQNRGRWWGAEVKVPSRNLLGILRRCGPRHRDDFNLKSSRARTTIALLISRSEAILLGIFGNYLNQRKFCWNPMMGNLAARKRRARPEKQSQMPTPNDEQQLIDSARRYARTIELLIRNRSRKRLQLSVSSLEFA